MSGIAIAGPTMPGRWATKRSEEHTSELQSQSNLVCRLLLEKKTPCSRAVNIRSVHTARSVHAQRERTYPSCLAVAGTGDSYISCGRVIANPSPCTPSLHRHYPASTLIWVL